MLSKILFPIIFILVFSCNQERSNQENQDSTFESKKILSNYDPSCEWCGANEAPSGVTWSTNIASEEERGDRIMISGTVYHEDREAPAKDVIVYVYHTNNQGVYPKRGDEAGNGIRHGYLRGWMKTNENGQYKFESIRPAAYQSHGGEPAHIHYVIKAPGKKEYWISALVFDDDPRLDSKTLKNVERDGGFSNITKLKLDSNGTLIGRRDIIIQNF